ncbi:MAG: hypothetical protein WDW38_008631 [Sanguina aurantia]
MGWWRFFDYGMLVPGFPRFPWDTGVVTDRHARGMSEEAPLKPNRFLAFLCGPSTSSTNMHRLPTSPSPNPSPGGRKRKASGPVFTPQPHSPAVKAAPGATPASAGSERKQAGPTCRAEVGPPRLDTVRASTSDGSDHHVAVSGSAPAAAVGGLVEKLGRMPLRLMIVGHNPSAHAWSTGHFYSNPSNHMWRLLSASGIAPLGSGPSADDTLPDSAGVGFTDVGTGHPGTDSSEFKSSHFQDWSLSFYSRLVNHTQEASLSAGCTCGACGAPCLVAFAGKRQYVELMNVGRRGRKVLTVPTGRQAALPPGWPLSPTATQVHVLPSSSGASALSTAQRYDPWQQLGQQFQQLPWPRTIACPAASNLSSKALS